MLKKSSIYVLDDENDRDFEFFVFVDPENIDKRPLFLKELYNLVINGGNEFSTSDHEKELKELKEWIGDDDKSLINPLNWIKIAIERYPYRFFVVIDRNKWQKNGKSPLDNDFEINGFIKKRICWIEKSEFNGKFEKSENGINYKIYLYVKWLSHILNSIREINKIEKLLFSFIEKQQKPTFYKPITLPKWDEDNDKEKINTGGKDIEIDLSNGSITPLNKKSELQGNALYIFLSRHGDFISYDKQENNWSTIDEDFIDSTYYSENLSGILSYYTQIFYFRENLGKFVSKWFFLKFAEQSLLRIGIADERFQEWWGKLNKNRAGSLFQSRIAPVFLEGEKLYGQGGVPRNKFYSIFNPSKKSGSIEFNVKDERLWPSKQQGLDLLSIHQGILDKWRGENKSKKFLSRDILNFKNNVPFIVIDSGRGRPDNVPNGIKFLSLSNIEGCQAGSRFERLTLLRQIMSIIEE